MSKHWGGCLSCRCGRISCGDVEQHAALTIRGIMNNPKNIHELDFMILHLWYWNWNEDDSISKVVLLKNDNTLDECAREVITKFALVHNMSRPKDKVVCKNTLTSMVQKDIKDLLISEQNPCQYTNRTRMNVLSYTNTKGDGHIEVMGLYTSTYELLG